MRPTLGLLAVAAFSAMQATIISILGFAPQAISTTTIQHSEFRISPSPTILFVGDLMFDRNVRKRMAERGLDYPLGRFSEIVAAAKPNAIVGNLEGAIGKRRPPEKKFDFAFDPAVAGMLARSGFNAVSLANNHAHDQGVAGYEETKKNLRDAQVAFFGHQVKDDLAPSVIDVGDRHVALLGYNTTDNPLDEKAAADAIRRAQSEYDLVIVMLHWGTEYKLKHNQTQTSLAHRLIDYGADAVIGAHPHVVQGLEIYKGKLIAYSLGNFIFDQYFSEETQQGITVALSFGEKTTFTVIPVAIVESQPRRMAGDAARKFLTALLGRSEIPKDIVANSVDSTIRGLDRGELVLTW